MRRLLLLLALSSSFFVSPAGAGEEPRTVRFLTPRRFAAAVGPSTATLEVVPPEGATIVSVELFVNHVLAGTTSSPPWMFSWAAGDGTMEHILEAVAKFSDGTEARASVTSGRRIVIESVDLTPVNVYAIARGVKGVYVGDLGPNDVHLYENGRPQALERVSAERRRVRIAIALDTSLSMEGEKLKSAIASAVAFLGVLQPGDEAFVVGFSDKVSILQAPTFDRRALESAIRSVSANGGSSLYDAIHASSEQLAAFDGRRVLLLLADGRDEDASGRRVGSVHTLEQARELALRNDVMVFAIGLGKYLAHDVAALGENPAARALEWDIGRHQPLATIISSLAATSGGVAVFAPGADQLRRSFEQVAEDLRHQYRLTYSSTDKRHDGSWREIKVVVDRPGVSMTSRTGYFAPSDLPGGGAR